VLARAAEHLTDVVKLQPVEGVVDDDVVTAGRGNHAHLAVGWFTASDQVNDTSS